MKTFKFSLDSVLDYKLQILDSLKVEHGAILALVHRQEGVLHAAEGRYAALNEEFCEKKRTGLTIADAMSYEGGLRLLEAEIRRELEKLKALQRQEAQKKEEVIQGKKETASLEILRDKKLDVYQKAVQKQEEQLIDEFVNTARVIAGREAAVSF